MALDTTGHWEAGDDLRIIEALLVPFGQYTLTCLHGCMAELDQMSPRAVLRVRELLDEYDAADQADSEQNNSNAEGKVLVKADVLEWEVRGGQSGPQAEKEKIRTEIWNYFAFCSCLAPYKPDGGFGSAAIIRS